MTTSTYQELCAQRDDLNQKIEAALVRERREAMLRILEKMNFYGISISELATASRGKTKKVAEVRFRNPQSGETWSGRGKPPRWIAGKDRAEFRV